MRQWKAWALAAGLAAGASAAVAQSPADAVVQQLREQGYVEFAVSRTLLGRIRVVALAPDGGQREIVFNPATGEILRDYHEAADGGGVPRILDRPEGESRPQVASSRPAGSGEGDAPQPDHSGGGRGLGHDQGGPDNSPGRGHGNDGTPGGGNTDHLGNNGTSHPGGGNSGNAPHGGGNGNKD